MSQTLKIAEQTVVTTTTTTTRYVDDPDAPRRRVANVNLADDVRQRVKAWADRHDAYIHEAVDTLLRRALDAPEPAAPRWEYREVSASQEEGARHLRDELLNDKWEPFAVYAHANAHGSFVVLCMRRLRTEPIC